MIPPRKPRIRGPLDPIHPSHFQPPHTTSTVRYTLAGITLMIFGLAMMVTTPSGAEADALAQSAWPAGLHAVCALIGVVGGAVLLAVANDRHCDDRRR